MPKEDGFEVTSNEKTIFFPTAELNNVGCRNCVWKLHAQCPHSCVDDKGMEKGICDEMLHFLTDLADKGDNLTAIWEKFLIYKTRLQESLDYRDFVELEEQIRKDEKKARTEQEYQDLEKLRMNKTAAKLWWHKLNQHAVQSMQKVMDRQAKSSGAARLPGIQSTGTINFNMGEPKKQLENKK